MRSRTEMRGIVTPWMRYPTVIGSDVAGKITHAGDGLPDALRDSVSASKIIVTTQPQEKTK